MSHHEDLNKKKRVNPLKAFVEKQNFTNRMVFAVSFIVVTLIMCLGLIPEQAAWQVGTTASRTIYADRSIIYEDNEETEAKIEEEIAKLEPVYTLSLDQFNNLTLVAVDRSFEKLRSIVVTNTTTEDVETTTDDADTSSTEAEVLSEEEEKKKAEIQESYSFNLTDEEWKILLNYDADHFDLLHRQAVALASDVMAKGVVEDEVENAKELLLTNVENSHAMSETDKIIVGSILDGVNYFATSVIDQSATEEQEANVRAEVEPVRHALQKDQVVVTKGEMVTAEQYSALKALGYTNDSSPTVISFGVVLAMLLFFIGLYKFDEYRFRGTSKNWKLEFSLILTVLTFIVISFPIISAVQIGTSQSVIDLAAFLIPVPAAAIMVTILVDSYRGIYITLILNLLLGMYIGNSYIPFVMIAGCLAGISQVKVLRRRTDVSMAGVAVMAAMAIAILAYQMITGFELKGFVISMVYVIGNGFLSIILTIGLLPYIERAFNITTSLSLMELCDPNTPLQRVLMTEAAGTYQHSLMVANLAERAALRVGADAQMVRTAALYHDIGKIKRPEFFSENQMTDENPHDKIAPNLSHLILTAHVKDGVALAKSARLPQPIIDMIAQHHGDSVVSYFYHKAHEADPEVTEDSFRYCAKRPQTREAAILMIADTVEAAVRSNMHRLNPTQVEGYIRQLIQAKFDDKQFSECDLTFRDLNLINDELARVINTMYHKRVVYPDKNTLTK